MIDGWPSPWWTKLAALCLLCGACRTFATVALVDEADGSVKSTDAEAADAPPMEGGADALIEGDAPITVTAVGSLTCGADGACNLASWICCTCPHCILPYPTYCFPRITGCVPAANYSPLQCGSSANCPNQISCCASFSTTKLTGASCRTACSSGDIRLCASDSECSGETKCLPLTQIPGFTGCQ